jgi:leader peptidase (prepilin peptidase)/N-methyltransferase
MQSPASQLILLIAAPFIGSFLGVVIERLPAHRPLLIARSRCDYCDATLGVRDLIPLMSWLATRGRCRHCGAWVGWFFPLVELAALGIAVWAVTAVPGWLIWPTTGFGWTLLALGWIDQRSYLLPDALTLPLAVAGLLVVWLIGSVPVIDHVIGAIAGFLALTAVAYLYRAVRRRDGLGGGDAKLFAAIGAWVGWQGLPTVILYAAVSGLLWALIRQARGKPVRMAGRLPFGPHLCLAGWLVWLYGPLLAG